MFDTTSFPSMLLGSTAAFWDQSLLCARSSLSGLQVGLQSPGVTS